MALASRDHCCRLPQATPDGQAWTAVLTKDLRPQRSWALVPDRLLAEFAAGACSARTMRAYSVRRHALSLTGLPVVILAMAVSWAHDGDDLGAVLFTLLNPRPDRGS